MSSQTLVVLNYLSDFQCIGPECEDMCCQGWQVEVDKATFERYSSEKDSSLKLLFERNLEKNIPETEAAYRKIRMQENGDCPFLSSAKWCLIQERLGASALSSVCATFPREDSIVDGIRERAASLACPEIARLVLQKPDGLRLETKALSDIGKYYHRHLETKSFGNSGEGNKIFWQVRTAVIRLMQARTFSTSERMILLGIFLKRLETQMQSLEMVNNCIENFLREISSESIENNFSSIPQQYGLQLGILKAIVDRRASLGINNQRYSECLEQALQGLTENGILSEKKYEEGLKGYFHPFFDEHDYIFENYLVNQIFKSLFPFGSGKELLKEYSFLVLHFSLIKMHLIGLGIFHKGLSSEIALKLIQSFSKTFENCRPFRDEVMKLLRQLEFSSLAHMAILLKD